MEILWNKAITAQVEGYLGRGVRRVEMDSGGRLLFTMTDGQVLNLGKIQGQDGVTPHFLIGTVKTLPAGSEPTVILTGTKESPVLNFGFPAVSPGSVSTDVTLTLPDTAADAAVTGQRLAELARGLGGKLPLSGGTMTGDLLMGNHNLAGIKKASASTLELRISDDRGAVLEAEARVTGSDGALLGQRVAFNGIVGDEPVILGNLMDPENNTDAATKGYVDTVLGGALAEIDALIGGDA